MDDELPPPHPDPSRASADPFPRDRMSAMVRRMPSYLKLTWRLGKDPMLSRARRAAVIAAAGYVVSPVDLVPGIIPVLGQLDDIAVALLALRLALDGLHPERRRAHLEAVGLDDTHLAEDLRTIGATTAWVARSGIRVSVRVLREGAHLGEEGAELAARSARRGATRLRASVGEGWRRRPRQIPRHLPRRRRDDEA